ncbi:glycosyltransferase family 4 protein [Nocardioides sp. KR10-350]|uniref:glycosyltransferase family 4 protein n=1 Tax=Nocardioides cheoyonin TaxID=3156615 RepID=UPI0032B5E2CD
MQRDDFEVRAFPGIDTVPLGEHTGRLRVAIVTEEILGPVRNGGIASTYHHLAKGLAAQEHEVHVLFLKGPVVQDETPEHWVETYARFGVALHYLEVGDRPLWAAAEQWQRRYAAAYEWLRDQDPFDVVHTSEWRGGLVYALMAKRLGLAFRDTLFVVKASSPYIWNRHYQMQPITQTHLVAAAHAEQKCVELADVVVGGSAHLISFMGRIGYELPTSHVFVQPNIVDFSGVSVDDRRPGPRSPGDLVRSRDLVFFGRLEERKGLEIFCSAVDLLHERGERPDSVTFLGKWGAALPSGLTPEAYVRAKAETWDCPVEVVTDRDQSEALSLLCERDVISVMPSLIENSSMAVYEALEQRVPFVATAVGGTPELIAEEDQIACLVQPTAQALADRLERVLREGQVIARPRFSNDENLKVWYDFHARLGGLIEEQGRGAAVAHVMQGRDRPGPPVRTVSYVGLVRAGETVEDLTKAFHEEMPDEIVLGYTDTSVRTEMEKAECSLADLGARVTIVNALGRTAGEALSLMVEQQGCDALVMAGGVSVVPQTGFFGAVRQGLTHRPGALLTTFFDAEEATVGMPLGGDVASQILTSRAYGPELVALRRETLLDTGGLEPYDARYGIVHAYVTRAVEAGHDLLVVPERLLAWPEAAEEAGP